MRLESKGFIQVPLSLWTADAFIEHVDGSNFLLGGYYGILLLIMLMALASYFKLGDKLFVFYVLHLLTYLLFQLPLNGLSYQYLWPNMPWVTNRITVASLMSYLWQLYLGGEGFNHRQAPAAAHCFDWDNKLSGHWLSSGQVFLDGLVYFSSWCFHRRSALSWAFGQHVFYCKCHADWVNP